MRNEALPRDSERLEAPLSQASHARGFSSESMGQLCSGCVVIPLARAIQRFARLSPFTSLFEKFIRLGLYTPSPAPYERRWARNLMESKFRNMKCVSLWTRFEPCLPLPPMGQRQSRSFFCVVVQRGHGQFQLLGGFVVGSSDVLVRGAGDLILHVPSKAFRAPGNAAVQTTCDAVTNMRVPKLDFRCTVL